MPAVHFMVVFGLSVLVPISCRAATVISTPGVQWSRDSSAVQLVWKLDQDYVAYSDMRIHKDNLLIIRYDRFISDSYYIHPNFTNRATVIDSTDNVVYLAGINISLLSIYDYGDYCAVFHSAGESCGATVVILGMLSGRDLSGELSVMVEDDVTLQCTAMSRTLPPQYAPVMTYVWNINDTTYSPGEDAGLPQRHSFRDADGQLNKKLVIASLERDDIYEYMCHARENGSSFMSEQSNTYTLLPYFSPGSAQPSETQLTINATNDMTLTCTASELGRPRGSWVWSKPGGEHVNTGTRGDLVIRNASVTGDDGIYSCHLANPSGHGAAGNITVTVNEKPSITEIGEVIVINTDALNVSCEVKARPGASIVWKYDDGGDLPGQIFQYFDHVTYFGKYTITTSYLIWFSGGQPDDRRGVGNRTITCKAVNSAGAASSQFDLNVQYVAYNVQIKPPPPEAIVEYQTMGPVVCSASCNPPCSYSWYKGGVQVSYTAELMIPNVTRDDHGVYECRPDNGIPRGQAASFSINVIYGPSIDTFDVITPSGPIDQGDDVTFSCQTDSRPMPVITLIRPSGDTLVSPSTSNTLEHTMTNIDCLDSGYYKCVAFNAPTGRQHSSLLLVTVKCPPRKLSSSDTWVTAAEGDTVTFSISVVAYPEPTFKWNKQYKGYVTEQSGDYRCSLDIRTRSTFTLPHIKQDEFGNYSVTTSNPLGEMEDVVFTLSKAGKPDVPSKLRVNHANAVSITMQWTSGWNRGGEQVFTLMYRRSDSDDSYTNITDISDPGQGDTVTSKAVGLLPETFYDFMVLATNQFGGMKTALVSASSATQLQWDKDGTLSVTTIGDIAIIKWHLHSYNGPITHVEVSGCDVSSSRCFSTTVMNITSAVEVAVPEGGSSYSLVFMVYDGEDLLLIVNHVIKLDTGPSTRLVVGVVVAVVLLCAVAAIICAIIWRRRRFSKDKDKKQMQSSPTQKYEDTSPVELGVSGTENELMQQELSPYEQIEDSAHSTLSTPSVYERPLAAQSVVVPAVYETLNPDNINLITTGHSVNLELSEYANLH